MSKKNIRRLIAGLMTVLMIIVSFPFSSMATDGSKVTMIEASELENFDYSSFKTEKIARFDEIQANSSSDLRSDDEEVGIIVELADDPAVALVETLAEALKNLNSLFNAQKPFMKTVSEIVSKKFGKSITIDEQFGLLFNGFSFDGTYGMIDEINSQSDGSYVAYEDMTFTVDAENGGDASQGMVNLDSMWNAGYTGKGKVVAIIDSGIRASHEAFSVMPEGGKIDEQYIADAIKTSNGAMHAAQNYTADELYINEKIPFGFNYELGVNDPAHTGDPAVWNSYDHGTHVAGIAAGNNGSDFMGMAPDAQIIAMNVFQAAGSASWSTILMALEDCTYLGVDAINMSLGSACGSTEYYTKAYEQVFKMLNKIGVSIAVSASNAGKSSDNNAIGADIVSNPDSSTVGSPSTFPIPLSIAAANNMGAVEAKIVIDGERYPYKDNAPADMLFNTVFGTDTLTAVDCGFGMPEEIPTGVSGKIALISRGSISFTEKVANAYAAGAVGVVVYNNQAGSTIMSIDEYYIPAISITQKAGELLLSLDPMEFTLEAIDVSMAPTYFTSWGTTSDLSIKPELMTPGHRIYSSVGDSDDSYESWNGTSMASPMVAGAMLLLREHIEETWPDLSAAAEREMVDRLLMNTATQVEDNEGVPYAVRAQGAGLMNLEAALNTEVYVDVTNSVKPKVEFGESDYGIYSFTATLHNDSDETVVFDVKPTVLIPDATATTINGIKTYVTENKSQDITSGVNIISSVGSMASDVEPFDGNHVIELLDNITKGTYSGDVNMEDQILSLFAYLNLYGVVGYDIPSDIMSVEVAKLVEYAKSLLAAEGGYDDDDHPYISNDAVAVAPGSTKTVKVSFILQSDTKEYIESIYENGTYIEGFVKFVPREEAVELSIPFLGFYGDWDEAPVLDATYYWDYYTGVPTLGYNSTPNRAMFADDDWKLYPLGWNMYTGIRDISQYNEDRNAISLNEGAFAGGLDYISLGLLRNASKLRIYSTNPDGTVSDIVSDNGFTKDIYNSNIGMFTKNIFYASNDEGNLMNLLETDYLEGDATCNDGDTFMISIEAELDHEGFNPSVNDSCKWEFPVTVDNTAPRILKYDYEDDKLTLTVADNTYAAAVILYSTIFNEETGLYEAGDVLDIVGVYENKRGAKTEITFDFKSYGIDANVYAITLADYATNEATFFFHGFND